MTDRPPPPDQAQRDRIRTELDRNFMVEAGAGSGKTTLLVARMRALITTGTLTAPQIAAVTFTRKAAAQLRERFQNGLEQALRTEAEPLTRDRLATALAELDRCFIGTVHAFCGRLLRERAIEAGVDPAFREIEGPEERLLEEAAWTAYLERERFGPALAELEQHGIDPRDLKPLYRTLAASPDVTPFTEDRSRPDLTPARAALALFLDDLRRRLPADPPAGGWDSLQERVRRALRLARVTDLSLDPPFIKVLTLLEAEQKVTLNRWPSKEEARAAEARLAAFRAETVLPTLQNWREYLHPGLVRFVQPAVSYYAERRRAASVLNYQDLLMEATALLRAHPHVRRYFAGRYRTLLIDEFQDTDPIQAELAMLLAGEPTDEENWRRLRPRPGSLFVVGDPRQSIYRFRRADITVYQEFKQLLTRTGGELLPLTANFRSVRAIGAWVNPVFAGLLPAAATPQQAAFGQMDAVQPDPDTFHGIHRITVPRVARHSGAEIARLDADRIAGFIASACAGGLTIDHRTARPADFMILTRTRHNLAAYARALEAYGLPYDLSGGRGVGDGDEIPALITLLRAVANPDDAIALLAVLRGLLFGLPDDLLYRFKKAGGRLSYLDDQPEAGFLDLALAPVVGALERLRGWWLTLRRLPLAAAVEQIVAETGLIPHLLSGEMGQSRAGSLLKLLELIRSTRARSLADAVSQVEALLGDGEVEEGQIGLTGENAVRLMNLHRAKGLEAHVVFLADPSSRRDHDPAAHVRRGEEGSVGYYLVVGAGEFVRPLLAQPPGWAQWEEQERGFEAAERDRLLYVAATRARVALVVSTYPEKEAGPWAALAGRLAGVDELPEGEARVQERALADLDVDALLGEVASGQAVLASAARPSHHVAAVTAQVHAASDAPPWHESDDGLSWGTAVHRYFEALAQGGGGLEFARAVLRAVDRDEEEAERLVQTGEAWMGTELWGRAMAAEERLVEVPVSAVLDGVLVSGTVDLAFREGDAWVLVDYKTDVVGEGELERFVRYYSAQLQSYARLWEAGTRERVVEQWLYFTHLGRGVGVCASTGPRNQ